MNFDKIVYAVFAFKYFLPITLLSILRLCIYFPVICKQKDYTISLADDRLVFTLLFNISFNFNLSLIYNPLF